MVIRTRLGAALSVLPLVVGSVFPRQDLLPPGLVAPIPLDHVAKACRKRNRWCPAKLGPDLRVVEGVAPVVAGPVFHVREKRLGAS
ncbi:MAG: hypothetical protein H6Q86_208, partial [candidate division NC10 bacterium]|nr:hypothetical protein [candidate division NC10 bacterium]